MRRRLIVVLGVVLVVILGIAVLAPYVTGWAAEREYRRLLAAYNRGTGMIELRSYRRGWFTSHAECAINLRTLFEHYFSVPLQDDVFDRQSLRAVTHSTLYHGPLAMAFAREAGVGYQPLLATMRHDTRVHLPPEWTTSPVAFATYGALRLDGSSRIGIQVPAYTQMVVGGVVAAVTIPDGARAQIDSDRALRRMVVAAGLPRLRSEMGPEWFLLNGAVFTGSYVRGPAQEWSSTAHTALECLHVNMPLVVLSNLVFTQTAHKHEALSDTDVRLAFKSADVDADHYEQSWLQLAVRNLDLEALHELQRVYSDTQYQHIRSRRNPAQSLTQLARIVMLLHRLLEAGPSLEISALHIAGPDGDLDATASVAVNKELVAQVERLSDVPRILSGSLHLRVPRAFVDDRRLPAALQSLLEANGSTYSLAASYHEGRLTINGVEHALGDVFGGSADADDDEMLFDD